MAHAFSSLYAEWQQKVEYLYNIIDEGGLFGLLSLDFFQLLEQCPPEHAKHYLVAFMKYVAFLLAETVVLDNGQLAFDYQDMLYEEYILEGIDTAFSTGLSRSTYTNEGCRLSVCSASGLEYLDAQKIRVSTILNYIYFIDDQCFVAEIFGVRVPEPLCIDWEAAGLHL